MILLDKLIVSLANLELNIAEVSDVFILRINADCVALLTGLFKSLVLSTLPRPTLFALMPLAIFESVIAPLIILSVFMALLLMIIESAVPPKSPANFKIPLVLVLASTIVLFELLLLLLLFPLFILW